MTKKEQTNESLNNKEVSEEKSIETVETQKKWTDAFKKIDSKGGEDIANLEQENTTLKDKMLRIMAELENTRRIAAEEKEKTIKFAISNFAKDLITVMENMYLAFKSVENVEKDDGFKVFFDGIDLTFNEFKKIFEKNNIKRIYPLDEKFDPTYHEAISQVENETEESGTIIDVVQAGYLLNGRVLKPAMVVVVK